VTTWDIQLFKFLGNLLLPVLKFFITEIPVLKNCTGIGCTTTLKLLFTSTVIQVPKNFPGIARNQYFISYFYLPHMEYEGSIGFATGNKKKIIADFHVLGLFIPKKRYLSKKNFSVRHAPL
jgi:hypothetical protein